jgi:hypothetical protein
VFLTKLTGIEHEEVMVEDWLSFSNTKVQETLVEAARPRSKDLDMSLQYYSTLRS